MINSKKILSIMQPTFIPYPGYFKLINISNFFVFLDDVQFEKQSWQTRNKIIINKEPNWVSLRIVKDKLDTKINFIKLFNHKYFFSKISKTFSQEYSNTKYFEDAIEVIDFINNNPNKKLSDINISIIKFICKKLEINTKFFLSSDFKITSKRTERIIDICNIIKPDIYLSTIGSKKYLKNDDFINKTTIKLEFFEYNSLPYDQKTSVFHPNLSILDLISNIGWEGSKKYLKQ